MKRSFAILLIFFCCFANTARAGQPLFDTTIMPAAALPNNYLPLLKGKMVALIINQTSVANGKLLLDMLLEHAIEVKKIFVPEHGFRGREDAGAHIDNSVDSATGLPVISLYGNHKQPTTADMEGVDVMVYDLQDVGVRFYTYISTLEYCMAACAGAHKQFVVLDRPNPNGFYVDGPVLTKENSSFVGMQTIPVVYGMTAGEYAQMLVGERWIANAAALDLKVVPCANYSHEKKYKLPIPPSPNLRTMQAVYVYPSLCLFEGTVVSVGRGTDLPFQQYGCPQFAGKYTYSFTPHSMPGATKPPFQDVLCYGELTGSTPAEVLNKINGRMNIDWLVNAYAAYPDKEKFFTKFFTKLAGTTQLEDAIKKGASAKEIRAAWQRELEKFKTIRKKYLLYKDFKE